MTRNFAENSCQEYVTELLSSTLKDTAICLRVGEQERERKHVEDQESDSSWAALYRCGESCSIGMIN